MAVFPSQMRVKGTDPKRPYLTSLTICAYKRRVKFYYAQWRAEVPFHEPIEAGS